MVHTLEYLFLGRTIAFELVGNDEPRRKSLFLEQFAQELLGSFGVTSPLRY
jgi:hypothetical protein